MSAMALEHAPRMQAEQAMSHAESYLRGEGAPAAPVNTFLPHRSAHESRVCMCRWDGSNADLGVLKKRGLLRTCLQCVVHLGCRPETLEQNDLS